MTYRSSNLVTGLQLRAARTLAGMTQRDLAAALGINERAVRFWERKRDRRPTSSPNDARIEQAQLVWEKDIFLQKFAHQFERRSLIPPGLDQHIKDFTLGIDSAPEIDHAAIY